MKKHFLFGLALGAAIVIGHEPTAEACGGCFIAPTENPSVVTDHRMIFSIGKDETTLYDQIRYTGSPESFAWVLPFAGDIDVGTSSDTLFAALDAQTSTIVQGPITFCPPPPFCGSSASGGFGSSGTSGTSGPGVSVLHQEVVGPYETTQLKATDPEALDIWLTEHNYVIPDSVKPVIAAYQAENFNFLAVKLVPGKGVQSMRPVRVTTKGSNVALPLRMVAAGTGATVGITLWVVGEGRYVPSNFESFIIEAQHLTWDARTQSSDYAKRRAERTATGGGRVWEIESADPNVRYQVENVLTYSENDYDEEKTDAGVVTVTKDEARRRDLEVLFGGEQGPTRDWITRIRADLSRAALDQDLTLKADTNQRPLSRLRQVTTVVNAPICPVYSPCPSSSGTSGASGQNGSSFGDGASPSDDDGCQTSPASSSMPWLGVSVAAALLALSRKRRRR